MTVASTQLAGRGVDVDEVVRRLNSFHAQNVVNALWADAVANRVEGPAIFLLPNELAEVAEDARAAAGKLADRIGDLGGAVTADPGQLVARSATGEFSLPDDCADVNSVLDDASVALDTLIETYQDFLDLVRGKDDISYQIVVKLLAADLHRRADIEATLAGPAPHGAS